MSVPTYEPSTSIIKRSLRVQRGESEARGESEFEELRQTRGPGDSAPTSRLQRWECEKESVQSAAPMCRRQQNLCLFLFVFFAGRASNGITLNRIY